MKNHLSVLAKSGSKRLNFAFSFIIFGVFLLPTIFSACRGAYTGAQTNQVSQSKKSDLPRDIKNAEQDNRIKYEESVVITIKDDSGAHFIGNEQIARERLGEIILEKLKDKTKTKYEDNRIVYIKCAENVQYGTLITLLQLIRKTKVEQVGLVVVKNGDERVDPLSYQFRIILQPDYNDFTKTRKPNPLLLVAALSKNGKIDLNKEDVGEIGNMEKLTENLVKIFKEREKSGIALREGTNEVEKTVWIEPQPTSHYGDVIRIIDEVKGAGAEPIGLIFEDDVIRQVDVIRNDGKRN